MWNRSSNFNKFIENFNIIKRLYEEEDKDIKFIARWLRMSIANLQHWIDRYFRSIYKQKEIETIINIKREIIKWSKIILNSLWWTIKEDELLLIKW